MDGEGAKIDGGRAEQEIFGELAELCASPGFVHVIAYLCIRDSMIRYEDEIKPEDMGHLYGSDHLVRKEINVLMGLMLKRDIDYSIPEPSVFQGWSERAEALLGELHSAMTGDMFAHMMPGAEPLTPSNWRLVGVFLGGLHGKHFQCAFQTLGANIGILIFFRATDGLAAATIARIGAKSFSTRKSARRKIAAFASRLPL